MRRSRCFPVLWAVLAAAAPVLHVKVAGTGPLGLRSIVGEGGDGGRVRRGVDRRGRWERPSVDDGQYRVEKQQVARPAGVDHTGLGQDGELLGGVRQRVGGGAA